ncbi:hypothetical protein VU02_01525, partial [Desulfobulbus sp. N2]|nr:hypothetical protein [Desulfobulbus sp. N2]
FWGNNRDVRDSLEKMVECKSWDSVGPYLEKAINSVKYHYPEYKEWAEPLLKIVCKESHIR